MTDWLTASEAAETLGVTTKTLKRWEAKGLIRRAHRTVGGHRRYSAEDVEAIRAAGTAAAEASS